MKKSIIAALLVAFSASSAFAQQISVSPDTAARILHCYHPSGQFRAVSVLEQPWDRAESYGADRSALVEIDWAGGLTNRPYAMRIGIMERDRLWRTVVFSDSGPLPPNPNCSNWH